MEKFVEKFGGEAIPEGLRPEDADFVAEVDPETGEILRVLRDEEERRHA